MKSFYYLGILLIALTLGLMSCSEEEDLNQYQEAELLNSEIMSKIQQDYDAWKAINGPIQIEHVSLSDLNQILKANNLKEYTKADFTESQWKLLNQPDFKPSYEKCYGGVAWFLGNWNGDNYFTTIDLVLITQFLNGMPGRTWNGSPTNSNALSSSYFTAYYYSFGGGILNYQDEDVARDVLLGILPCN